MYVQQALEAWRVNHTGGSDFMPSFNSLIVEVYSDSRVLRAEVY